MPTTKWKCKGLYGCDRVVSWPAKKASKCDEESIFIMIRKLLEEQQDLTISCENDRLILTHLITKAVKKEYKE